MLHKRGSCRRATAAVELSVLLPFLAVMFVIAIDWARIFYYSITIENCARNGALYAADSYALVGSPYTSVSEAALADAPNLQPTPSVSTSTGTDANGRAYVDCTVTYNFKTVSNFPLVPSTTVLTRTVRVYQYYRYPK
jgi:Flp pilus assembly protein TadG